MKTPKRQYYIRTHDSVMPDEEAMTIHLLDEGVLLVGCTPEYGTQLYIECSDTFMPAADAQSFSPEEIPGIFELYAQKGHYGIVEWVALKRKRRPMGLCVDVMKTRKFWTEELEQLPVNPDGTCYIVTQHE